MRLLRRALVLGLLGLGASLGCSTVQVAPKEPAKCDLQMVTLSILTSRRVNPTAKGEARPVQVRIYQLKTDIRLQNASFEDIWKDDKGTLLDDLVKADEVSVYPDDRAVVQFARNPAAGNLVGVALFRTPKGRSWFTSFEMPLPPGKEACAARCKEGECDGGVVLDPKFAMWIDETQIEDGTAHMDDERGTRETRVASLRPIDSPPSPPATGPGPAQEKK